MNFFKRLFSKKKAPSKPNVEVVGQWKDDLIGCPSQCTLNLKYGDRFFILSLRWRWSDPWTASLIECDSDFDHWSKNSNTMDLGIRHYRESQLFALKCHALDVTMKLIPTLPPWVSRDVSIHEPCIHQSDGSPIYVMGCDPYTENIEDVLVSPVGYSARTAEWIEAGGENEIIFPELVKQMAEHYKDVKLFVPKKERFDNAVKMIDDYKTWTSEDGGTIQIRMHALMIILRAAIDYPETDQS